MYWWKIEDLYHFLKRNGVLSQEEVSWLTSYRRIMDGRLPIGSKLHIMHLTNPETKRAWIELFNDLVVIEKYDDLIQKNHPVRSNMFKKGDAQWCFILPPVGSPQALATLIRALERYIGDNIFSSASYQFQLCAAGRLIGKDAALLGIIFYLASDTIRHLDAGALRTTVSHKPFFVDNERGVRMVLHGVGDTSSTFDSGFIWWGASGSSSPKIMPKLPFSSGSQRTDILAGQCSYTDLRNFNLISTLLVHKQYRGHWGLLGKELAKEVVTILRQHQLEHLLELPWVHEPSQKKVSKGGLESPVSMTQVQDMRFLSGVQDLVAVAQDEMDVYQSRGELPANSLLRQVAELVWDYDQLAKIK